MRKPRLGEEKCFTLPKATQPGSQCANPPSSDTHVCAILSPRCLNIPLGLEHSWGESGNVGHQAGLTKAIMGKLSSELPQALGLPSVLPLTSHFCEHQLLCLLLPGHTHPSAQHGAWHIMVLTTMVIVALCSTAVSRQPEPFLHVLSASFLPSFFTYRLSDDSVLTIALGLGRQQGKSLPS